MSSKQKFWAATLIGVGLVALVIWKLQNIDIPVLQPSGPIGQKEKNLIVIAFLLSMIVVIPVFFMLIFFSLRYREGNKKARYDPDLSGSRLFESVWWGVPIIIITILGIITWRSSQQLDPFKPLSSTRPSMTIQAVSLQWKWLFIYPKEGVASVNYLQFPVNTPIRFEVTSDAPMNSFWIPQLGGQIYAMSGMSTNLNLEASKIGTYQGSSANISGEGFSDMNFVAYASSQNDFNRWLEKVGTSANVLDQHTYTKLAAPSRKSPISYYGSATSDMFGSIIHKYESPVYFDPTKEPR